VVTLAYLSMAVRLLPWLQLSCLSGFLMNMDCGEPPNTWMWYFECDLVEEGMIIDVDRTSLKNRQHADTYTPSLHIPS
jgi:hypothetical protein